MPNANDAKSGGGPTAKRKPLIEIPEEEQLRLINETGVLHKVKDKNGSDDDDQEYDPADSEAPPLFTSIMLAIPLTMFHQILDFAVHQQYGFESEFTLQRVLQRAPLFFVALIVIGFVTTRFRKLWSMQFLFACVSAVTGVMIIKLSEGHETFGNMLKTPGMAVIWVYMVIQMRLELAVLSLVVPLLYYYRDFFKEGKRTTADL